MNVLNRYTGSITGRLQCEKLAGSDLRFEVLQFPALASAVFDGADLSFARIMEPDLTGASLTDCRMVYGVIINPSLRHVCFRNSDLRNCSIGIADVSGCDFRGADLRRAHIVAPSEGCFYEANFRGALIDDSTRFEPSVSKEVPGLIYYQTPWTDLELDEVEEDFLRACSALQRVRKQICEIVGETSELGTRASGENSSSNCLKFMASDFHMGLTNAGALAPLHASLMRALGDCRNLEAALSMEAREKRVGRDPHT